MKQVSFNLESIECISLSTNMHNAFTDLIYYQDTFWCAYREASTHMSLDGKVVILRLNKKNVWKLFGRIHWAGGDMRDPKFVIDGAGELILLAGVRLACVPNNIQHILSTSWIVNDQNQSIECLSSNEKTWRWSAENVEGDLLSVGYAGEDKRGVLYHSMNGIDWQAQCPNFFPKSDCFSNETSLAFDKKSKTLHCLLRRDGQDCPAMLGFAYSPYKIWQWQTLNKRIGGPKLAVTEHYGLLAGFRIFTKTSAKMVIAQINTGSNLFFNEFVLPSEGDCSYPGLVVQNNKLYVSYYSSHEEKTAIYFALITLS